MRDEICKRDNVIVCYTNASRIRDKIDDRTKSKRVEFEIYFAKSKYAKYCNKVLSSETTIKNVEIKKIEVKLHIDRDEAEDQYF